MIHYRFLECRLNRMSLPSYRLSRKNYLLLRLVIEFGLLWVQQAANEDFAL